MRSASASAWARMASRCSWSTSEFSSQNSTSGRKIATTATATMCMNTMREISDLNVGLANAPARNSPWDTLFLLGHEIADTADGVDHDPGAVLGELLAQPRNVDLDGVGGDLAFEAENVVLDVLLRHHAPLPAQ